ncbi:MAG: family transporter substrate-binding protein [Rhodospirillales bacterium]|jgi:basic membrane protein A|nr:family transporter substrate-binding protein [Rhodospirillales bacterium]
MTKFLGVLLALFLLPGLAFAQTKELKVALVLPGSVTDGTYNSAADKGMKEAQKKYPQLKVSVRENTGFADSEEALLAYARDGYDVVIGHGFQFAEPAMKIHKQFPKTWFIVNTAKAADAPNLAATDNRWGDAGYIGGAVAASVSKTGIIGHIGGIPVPVIQEYNEGFERGAKHINPNIKMLSAYVGSFSDIAKGKEITISLIEQGADVVTSTGNENVVGTLEAAKEKKVMMIGTAFDSAEFAPDTVVTTMLVNFDVNLELVLGKIIDSTIEPKTYLLGLNENGIGVAPYRKFEDKISPENKAKIAQIIDDIKNGKVADLPAIR